MTGLLRAQLMELEKKEFEEPANGLAAIRSSMETIFDEIDNLEEFNRTTGLSQASLSPWTPIYISKPLSPFSRFITTPGSTVSLCEGLLSTKDVLLVY